MRNIIIEMSPIDKASNLPVVLRLASAHANSQGTILDGKAWAPVITSAPDFSYTFWSSGQPQPLDVSYGNFRFLLNARDFDNLSWGSLQFKDQIATVWIGTLGDAFAGYRKLYTGPMGALKRSGSEATVELLGNEASLIRPLLSASYAGTGGAEGTTNLTGNLKPFSMGQCLNVTPVLVDPVYWIYQVNAYGPCTTSMVYELGIPIADAPKATSSTYDGLKAIDLKPGEWARSTTSGLIRLGGEPKSSTSITADIGTAATAGDIITAMLTAAGQVGKVTPSIAAATASYCYFTKEQVTILDAVREIALHAGKYLITDANGNWYLGSHVSTKTPIAVDSERSTDYLIRPDTIVQEAVADPAWRVKVGYDHAFTFGGEMSAYFAGIGADLLAKEAAIKAAQDAADKAQADADIANARYLAMAADGVLDRPEKLDLIQRVQSYAAEKPGIIAQAVSQGVVTARTAYENAYNALMTYLGGLTPAWNDTSQDTPIDRPAFLAATNGYLTARQALENVLVGAASETGVWDKISDPNGTKPDDNADVTSEHTSKDTAAVNGTPAKDVMDKVVKIDGIVQDISDLRETYGDTAAAKAYSEAAQAAAADAGTKAQNASASAGNASTSATNASGSAQVANDKAAAAATSATQSAGFRDQASTFAENASNSATSASADAARASSSVTLAAQVSSGAINSNAAFNVPGYTGGVPAGWSYWNASEQLQKSPQPGRNGTIPVLMNRNGAQEIGLAIGINNISAGWYVIEAEVQKLSETGNWQGAGVHCNFNNGTAINMGFGEYPDINGLVYNGAGFNRRSWSVMINNPVQANIGFYAMGGWSVFGLDGTSADFHWHKCLIRPATDGEIKGQKAFSADPATPIAASVKTVSDAVATLNGSFATFQQSVNSQVGEASSNASIALSSASTALGRTGAYFQVQASSPGGLASITVASDNGAASVEIVGNVTFRGNLNVGADSGARQKITNSSIAIYDGNNVQRVYLGL